MLAQRDHQPTRRRPVRVKARQRRRHGARGTLRRAIQRLRQRQQINRLDLVDDDGVRGGAQRLGRRLPGRWSMWHAPARVIDAVDTLGAGDGFSSGYALAVLQGDALPMALAWGNLCGAHVAARTGVINALPDAQGLAAMIEQAPPAAARQLTFE